MAIGFTDMANIASNTKKKFLQGLNPTPGVISPTATASSAPITPKLPPAPAYDWKTASSPFTPQNAPKITGALTGGGTTSEMKSPLPSTPIPTLPKVTPTPTPIVPTSTSSVASSIIPQASAAGEYNDTDLENLQILKNMGVVGEDAMNIVNEKKAQREGKQPIQTTQPEQPQDKGIMSSIGDFLTTRHQLPTIPKFPIDTNANTTALGLGENLLKTAGNVGIGVINLPLNAANMAGSTVQEQYQGAKNYVQDIANSPDFSTGFGKVVKTIGENPLETALAVKGGIEGAKSIYSGAKGIAPTLERAAGGDQGIRYNIKTGEATPIKPTVETPVNTEFTKAYGNYKKAISPSVKDTNTPQKAQAHQQAVKTTAQDIIDNKDSLTYTDKDGNIVDTGRTPQNINEQSQALVQRSDALYDEYRNLEKQTGLDTKVDYNPVVENLKVLKDKVSKNPELQDLIPYIDKKIETYSNMSGDLDSAIEAKKTLNQKLKSFYRNQNYADVGKDAVDAITNKSIGEILDNSINNSQYGELKQKWGANKQLQKETFHRDNVTARQKEYGFFDLANPLSAVEMIDSLVTGNPLGAIKAAGIQGVKWYMKNRNSPNTQIQEFYKNLEGANREGTIQKALGLKNQSVSLNPNEDIYSGLTQPKVEAPTVAPKVTPKLPRINLKEEIAKARKQ